MPLKMLSNFRIINKNMEQKINKNYIIFALLILLAVSLFLNFSKNKNVVGDKIFKLDDLNQNPALKIYNDQKNSLPSHQLYCIPERKISCSINGCEDADPNVFVLISDNDNNFTISRCDNKPCDVYEATPYFSGNFMEIRTNDNHGMLFKTSLIDSSFVEVITFGTDMLSSYGHCYKNN